MADVDSYREQHIAMTGLVPSGCVGGYREEHIAMTGLVPSRDRIADLIDRFESLATTENKTPVRALAGKKSTAPLAVQFLAGEITAEDYASKLVTDMMPRYTNVTSWHAVTGPEGYERFRQYCYDHAEMPQPKDGFVAAPSDSVMASLRDEMETWDEDKHIHFINSHYSLGRPTSGSKASMANGLTVDLSQDFGLQPGSELRPSSIVVISKPVPGSLPVVPT